MDFILNEYHQSGISDDELIIDLKRVSSIIDNKYLSMAEYVKYGKYNSGTFSRRFTSWINALNKAELRTKRNNMEMRRINNEMLIKDIRTIAKQLGKESVTYSEYNKYGKYSFPTIKERYNTWENFLRIADLKSTGFVKRWNDIDMFLEIKRIWRILGRQPTTTDMKKKISRVSLDAYSDRFGGWRKALIAFLDYINQPEIRNENNSVMQEKILTISEISSKSVKSQVKRTPRGVNLQLRFKVLERDSFKCCVCGASPAKELNIVLHVDHIVPWSKGGETAIDNLQTLCSECNLGKSNM
jgi:hypothetical protein